MSLFEAFILGVVQGLTEFLPVSSSGHLVLFQNLFGIKEPMIAFDIAVHWGTLFAVFAFYRKELAVIIADTCRFLFGGWTQGSGVFARYPGARTGFLILAATIPTGIIGIGFEDFFESLFHSLAAVAGAWLIIGLILILASRHGGGKKTMTTMKWMDAVRLGVAQGVAIIPGISRSGITICAGMLSGIEKSEAARFSFLMAIPAILGAGILKMGEGIEFFKTSPGQVLIGFFASLFVGYAAIAFLIRLIQRDKLYIFGYYCIGLSLLTFGFVFLQH